MVPKVFEVLGKSDPCSNTRAQIIVVLVVFRSNVHFFRNSPKVKLKYLNNLALARIPAHKL